MQLQQVKDFASGLLFRKWKVWIAVAVMATSLLLSSCSNATEDYKTDLGDPSLYKDLYIKADREVKSLRKELENKSKEITKLESKYAALKAQKLNVDLSERDKTLDEREKNVSERENQIKQDRAEAESVRDTIFDKSVEIGKKAGQLEKDEERIKELSKELTSLKNEKKNSENRSMVINSISIILAAFFAIYIFLDKYEVLKPRSSEKYATTPTIDIKDITPSNKLSNAGTLSQGKDSDLKALPPENA